MIRIKGEFTEVPNDGVWRVNSTGVVSPSPIDWGHYGSFLTARHLEFIDSTSNPSWFAKKTVRKFIPPKIHKIDLREYLREPVEPVYNPPKWSKMERPPVLSEVKIYPFKPPRRFASDSDEKYFARVMFAWDRYRNHLELVRLQRKSSYTIRLHKWEDSRDRHLKHLQSYETQFSGRKAKYLKRLAILERRRLIVKNWQKKGRLVSTASGQLLPDNPYTRYRFVGMGGPIKLHLYYLEPWGMPSYNDFPSLGIGSLVFNGTPLTPELFIQGATSGFQARLKSTLSSHILNLDAKLLLKLRSKIRSGDLQVANIVAERAQTLGMFRDVIKRIADLASGRKRLIRSVSHFIRNPKLIANDFLAFQFGVLPLLSDAHSLGETLARWNESEERDFVAYRVNNKENFDVMLSNSSGTFSAKGFVEISYAVKYSVSNVLSRELSMLGLVNPVEIAWEVLPWSFVVDWFIPVQKWLESLSSEVGLQFSTGTRKVRIMAEVTQVDSNPGAQQFNPLSWLGGVGTWRGQVSGNFVYESKERTVFSSLPEAPDLVITKDPVTSTHLFESLALIVQKLFK